MTITLSNDQKKQHFQDVSELDPVIYSQVWGLTLRQAADELDIDYDNLRKVSSGRLLASRPVRRIAALTHRIKILEGNQPLHPELIA